MGDQGNMKYILEVEDHNNIRTLVIGDLKKLGIKAPKSKKIKATGGREENTDYTNQCVFGNQLTNVPSLIVEECGPVPRFLVEATEFLENQIHTVGLFRKSGSVSRQKELKDKVELGERLQDAQPHDVASLIKQFFRQLPDALLTTKLHDTFLKCHHLEKGEERRMAVFLLCLLLPWHHLSTLRFFMQFLARIARHADQNKMDVSNLALCLAPNLLHLNVKAEKMRDSETKLLQVQTSIIRLLIEHPENIGMLNETLYDQALLMGSLCCFPSDDELEKSCDELDDSQPVKGKKKKKKKRSGSLQGLVNNLSSSFSKWRREGKGHNSSSVSDKSSMTSMSTDIPDASCVSEMSSETCHVTLPTGYQTPKLMRKRKASPDLLPFSATKKKAILQQMPQRSMLGTPYTPANRRRPGHEFALDTPSIKFVDGSSQLVFTATPGEGHPPGGTPRRKIDRILSPSSAMKVKRHTAVKSNCFSPKTPKSAKRRSMKGFFRRLSGSKESPVNMDSSDTVGKRLANVSSCSMPGKKKGGFFRRRTKTPSSPARLVGNLLPRTSSLDDTSREDSISMASTMSIASTTSLSSQESITSLELASKLEDDLQFPNHKRRYSAEGSPSAGLRRGRPNTITVGLPEPAKRRSLDPSNSGYTPAGPVRHSSQREIVMSPQGPDCLNCSPVAFTTSPIRHKANLQMLDCSPIGMAPLRDDDEKMEMDLDSSDMHEPSDPHLTSVLQDDSSPANSDVTMTHVESDHERAFIEESVCGEPSDEPKVQSDMENNNTELDSNSVFKKPMILPKPKENPSAALTESQLMDSSANTSDASDASVITVLYNNKPIRSSRPQTKPSLLAERPAVLGRKISQCQALPATESLVSGTSSTMSPDCDQTMIPSASPIVDDPKTEPELDDERVGASAHSVDKGACNIREGIVNLQTGRVASTVSQFSVPDSDCSDVLMRHATALRFPNSVSRTRGTSPVRIPTIFAKADREASMYREITRNVLRGSAKTGVKGKANLPITTKLVRSSSVENARQQLTTAVFKSPDPPDAAQLLPESESTAGHTPVRHAANPELHPVEINESLLNTIEDVCTPKSEKLVKEALRTPLTDSTNTSDAEVLPRIKQPMLVSDVGNRLLTKSLQYRMHSATASITSTPIRKIRLPVKSVKRLQGSPHTPLSPKSPKRYHPATNKQPSPIPGHVRDWNV